MAAVEQLSIIRAALDPTGYTTGAQAIQRANAEIGRSQATVQAGSQTTTRAMESAERAFIKTARGADQVAKELLAFQRAQETANRAVTLGVATQDQAATMLAAYRARVDAAVVSKQRLAGAAVQTTNALGVTRQQMQQLAPQINDVATSLLGGASAFQVLTQQGGQITQVFGGVGNTFRALAGIFTPTRIAIAGVTLAVGAAVLAFETTESRIARLQNTLRVTRGDWQAFAVELDRRSRSLAPSILPFTATETESVMSRLGTALPTDLSPQLERLTRLAADLSRTLDTDASSAAQRLTRMYSDLEGEVRQLSERGVPGFTEAFRRHIEVMVAEGRSLDAYLEVVQRLEAALGAARDNIRGTEAAALNLARAWDNIRIGATRFLEGAGEPLIRFFGDAAQGATRFEAALNSIARATLGLLNPLQQFRNLSEAIFGRSPNIPFTVGTATGAQSSGAPVPTAGAAPAPLTLSSVALANIPERHRPPDTGSPLDAAYLRDRLAEALGLTPAQSSGIVSGLTMESGLRTGNIRPGGADYGLAQWVGPRRNALFDYADQQGTAAYDPETQINFLIREIQQYPRILERMRGTSDPFQAGQYFHDFLSGGAQQFESLRDWHAGPALRIARLAPAGGGSSAWGQASAAATGAAPAAADATGAGTAQQRESDRMAREAAGGRSAQDDLSRARIAGLEAERNRITTAAEGRDLTAEEATRVRDLTQAIERETAAINGRETATERSIRTGRDNLRVLQTEDDLRREIAREVTSAREAARSEGRTLSVGEERAIEQRVRDEARAAREDGVRTNERLIQSERDVAQAYLFGARSGLEAAARQQAINDARRTTVTGTAEWRTEVERLTQQYLRLGLARAEGQVAQQLVQQEQTLALLRAENDAVGRNTEERQRNLAVRREEERLRGIHPDLPNTEAGRRAIGNAGRIADEQLRGRRLSEIEGYGREAGAIIGKGITDAIRTGSLRGFKEIPGMLWEIMARGLITKPLEEWFSQMARNLFNSGGVFGGGGGGGGGFLSGIGSALGIGSLGGIAGTGMLGKSFAEVSFAAIAHEGGMPGQTGAWRAVPASVFHEAPRYHTGRGPGAWVAPNEIATILTRDEVVLNRRQQERAASAMRMGGRPVTVVQNITTRDAGSFDRSQAQNAARARRAFLRTGRSA